MARSHLLEEREGFRDWTGPKLLREKPVHRWYAFPHSFSPELVHALMEEWGLGPRDKVLDPFVGAGTTLLAAKEKGIPATGYDLSPLAVFASRVKVADHDPERLHALWRELQGAVRPGRWSAPERGYPELVRKALPGELLHAFASLDRAILELPGSDLERGFFRLALLALLREYSRARAGGGWLRWSDPGKEARHLPGDFAQRVALMLFDLEEAPKGPVPRVERADARALPDEDGTYSAVITSPPYPNRHDYTRVFGVELLFAFLDPEEVKALRYRSFHSHPEARPVRPGMDGYAPPEGLLQAVEEIARQGEDRRVVRMLLGYFADMHLVLREVARVCKPGARIAFVVGNARYRGVPVLVDEFAAEIGEGVGLRCERLLVARRRGNSAQQMGRYGKEPSRETVVVFRKEA